MVAGALAAAWGASWRASWIIKQLLGDGAAETIARESGGVYLLKLGRVRFDWGLRRVGVDSISLTTRGDVNVLRPDPLPGVEITLSGCRISGIHYMTLIRNAGLVANSFGCRAGSLVVDVPRRVLKNSPKDTSLAVAAQAVGVRAAFLVFQQGVRLPGYAPRVRIAQVVFPEISLDVRLPRTTRGTTRLELERLQWSMTDLSIDPADAQAAARPLFSRTVELVATNFVAHPGTGTAIRVGRFRANLTDSTVEVRNIGFEPTAREGEPPDPYRHDAVKLAVGRITVVGVDAGAFLVGQARARRLEVDSLRIDVTDDKRLPEGPGSRHRTPQRWIADLDETLKIDSLLVRDGEVVYREHAPERERPGTFTFARIEAVAANLSHVDGRRTSEDAMTLSAHAHLQGTGRLDVRFVVPLDAPRFDMTVRGTLGPMPVVALNPFVTETGAVQIDNGEVTGVDFGLAVKSGIAKGTITPRFTNLAISVTRDGSDGILGGGGILGGAARRIAAMATRGIVRTNNPDSPSKKPGTGSIYHAFTPGETLVAFLWVSLRDGLFSVVKR